MTRPAPWPSSCNWSAAPRRSLARFSCWAPSGKRGYTAVLSLALGGAALVTIGKLVDHPVTDPHFWNAVNIYNAGLTPPAGSSDPRPGPRVDRDPRLRPEVPFASQPVAPP